MAISGKFVADFENFKAGADDAVLRLKKLEKGADAVDKAAKRMTTPTGGGTSGFSKLSNELNQVDRILNLTGISIGHEIGALKELGTIAETAGGSLGLLGPAALVAGTAIGSWQLGKVIGEATGLTTAIEKLTVAYLGLPSAAEEAGKAQADVFKRALELTGQSYQTQEAAQQAINVELAKRQAFLEDHKKAVDLINGSLLQQRTTLAGISGETKEGAKYLLQQGIDAKNVAAYYGLTLGQVTAINRELERGQKLLKQQSGELQAQMDRRLVEFRQQQAGAERGTQTSLGDYSLRGQIDNLKTLQTQLDKNAVTTLTALDEEQRRQENLVEDEFEYAAIVAKHEQERLKFLDEWGAKHAALSDQIAAKNRELMDQTTALLADAFSKINDLQKAAYERRGLVGEGAEAGQVARTKTPQEEYDKAIQEAARAAEMLLAQTQNAAAAQQLYDAMVKDASDRFLLASDGFIQNFSQAGATVAVFGKSVQDTVSKLEIISGESGEGPLVGVFGNTPESVYNPRPKTGMFNPFALPGFSLSGPSPGVNYNVNVNVSGVFDPRTKQEIADAVGDVVMRGRQWGNR